MRGGIGKGLTVTPDYQVGYARPPIDNQFKPGKSGNPKGRPKGSKNRPFILGEERLKGIILEEAYRTITVNDAGRSVTVPMAQAIVRSLAVNAAKGNHRSQRLFSELLSTTEREDRAMCLERLDTAITYKVEWERELDRRQALGICAPDPIPHPDNIHINFNTGEVTITGPMTRDAKRKLDEMKRRKIEFEEELRLAQQRLKKTRSPHMRKFIQFDIDHANTVLDIIRRVVPD